ncbi:hypothetical protein T12_5133 [Trichinella patagoniensis]|uniref:Uncharacterized protein n=1 Tax=Trichinella patagoniensis TaxID=990121 RepID=A0A0V0XTF6_9BILA|nr:hypothetical protein T12_5133 [Trichinella patagoniensis]
MPIELTSSGKKWKQQQEQHKKTLHMNQKGLNPFQQCHQHYPPHCQQSQLDF